MEQSDRGRLAEQPTEVPPRGWKDVLIRVKSEAKEDHVSLLSAGVAFYALLALVPALVALLSIYGLVADPEDIERQVLDALSAAPAEVREMVSEQLTSIQGSSAGTAVFAAIAGIVLALWSASSGIKHLIEAINAAYDEKESRGFVRLRGLSLAFTAGAVVFFVIAFGAIALLPSLLAETGLGTAGRIAAGLLRWVVLLAGLLVGLAVLYRYAPSRENARWAWVSPGALLASVLWLAGSVLFSIYTANFGKYNETYGSLGVVVVVMLWLFLTMVSIVLGAELNAEVERQTVKDTTSGRPAAMGSRGAYAADTVGESSDASEASG